MAVPGIGMPLTTTPLPAVTTPLPLLVASIGCGVVPGIGMGVGDSAREPEVAGVTTGAGVTMVPGAVVTGVLYTGPDLDSAFG